MLKKKEGEIHMDSKIHKEFWKLKFNITYLVVKPDLNWNEDTYSSNLSHSMCMLICFNSEILIYLIIRFCHRALWGMLHNKVYIINSVFKIQEILDSKANPISRFEAKKLWSHTFIFKKSKVYIICLLSSTKFTNCNLL